MIEVHTQLLSLPTLWNLVVQTLLKCKKVCYTYVRTYYVHSHGNEATLHCGWVIVDFALTSLLRNVTIVAILTLCQNSKNTLHQVKYVCHKVGVEPDNSEYLNRCLVK